MRLAGVVGAAVLISGFGITVPAYSQHGNQGDRPAKHEDHGEHMAERAELLLQVHAVQTGHADIGDEAGNFAVIEVIEERLRIRKGHGTEAFHLQQIVEGLTHCRVIIHDRDQRRLGQTKGPLRGGRHGCFVCR